MFMANTGAVYARLVQNSERNRLASASVAFADARADALGRGHARRNRRLRSSLSVRAGVTSGSNSTSAELLGATVTSSRPRPQRVLHRAVHAEQVIPSTYSFTTERDSSASRTWTRRTRVIDRLGNVSTRTTAPGRSSTVASPARWTPPRVSRPGRRATPPRRRRNTRSTSCLRLSVARESPRPGPRGPLPSPRSSARARGTRKGHPATPGSATASPCREDILREDREVTEDRTRSSLGVTGHRASAWSTRVHSRFGREMGGRRGYGDVRARSACSSERLSSRASTSDELRSTPTPFRPLRLVALAN